jgi:hypothetical protein
MRHPMLIKQICLRTRVRNRGRRRHAQDDVAVNPEGGIHGELVPVGKRLFVTDASVTKGLLVANIQWRAKYSSFIGIVDLVVGVVVA